MTTNRDRDPIKAPASRPGRDVTRSVVESAAELIPGAGIVTGVLRVSHPPKSEQDRDEWQSAISERSNEHDDRLDQHDHMLAPTETVEGLPAQLLARLVHDCPDGLGHEYHDIEDLGALFPEEDEQAIEDAVFDLRTLGLLRGVDHMTGWAVAIDASAYEQVDRQVMGWDTEADALVIAQLMLSDDTGHAPDLHARTGWSKRRFNPAFRLLLPMFPPGRVRSVIQADYPSLGVALAPEDRAKLRRLVAKSKTSAAADGEGSGR